VKVAITCGHLQRDVELHRERIEAAGHQVVLPNVPGQELAGSDLIEAMDGIDGVIAGDDQFSAEVLDALPGLSVISKWGIGLDAIDLDHAAERGVIVTNTPAMFGNEVAEQALGYLIALVRSLTVVDHEVRNGGWPKPVGRSLGSLRACVLGLGNIGSTLAQKLLSLGLTVSGSDPAPSAVKWCADNGVTHGELASLVTDVDVLFVTCPLNEATRGIVDHDLIGVMPRGSWLVNVGRGPVVRLDAVVAALESGHLAGAGLDVYEEEPLGDHPIRTLANVILGSHNASNTWEACQRTHVASIKNLLDNLTAP
jgi:D-3-phosphoglycerate dehydrogenase